MQSEIKNTIYIGISCAILAMVLGFVTIMFNIRGTIADSRNSEVVARESINNYNTFGAFDGKKITGMQLIRLISESYDLGIEVYVSGITDASNKTDSGTANAQLYTNSLYLRNMRLSNGENIYNCNDAANTRADGTAGDISDCYLVKMYANTSDKASKGKYYAYLVYNNDDPATAVETSFAGSMAVTAVRVTYVP